MMIKTTIVGFGDSLTYGYGIDKHITYTDRLERFMPQYYPRIQWNIINSGINGDTSREGLARLDKDVLSYHPNIVLILFGSNDSAFNEDQYRTPYEFQKNMEQIAAKILEHNNHTGLNHSHPIPVLITPPPIIDTDFFPFTTLERVKSYGKIIKKICTQYHLPCIDFFTYLLKESGGKPNDFLQEDGIHLSHLGYNCFYDCIFSGISRLIDREGILKNYNYQSVKN